MRRNFAGIGSPLHEAMVEQLLPDLAKMYLVLRGHIRNIVSRKAWSHVD